MGEYKRRVPLTEHRRQYLESNRKKIKAQQKIRSAKWYEQNREEMLRQQKAQYDANPEAYHKNNRLSYQLHRESRLKQMKGYRQEHIAEIKAAGKKWRQENKSKKSETDKQYRLKNADHVREIQRAWKQKNKHRVRLSIIKRKALKNKATVNLTGMKEWMKSVLSKPFSRCYYCDERIATKSIHIEHIVPLIEGGFHAVENLCVSCGPCNLTKGSKQITVWVKPGQQILAL